MEVDKNIPNVTPPPRPSSGGNVGKAVKAPTTTQVRDVVDVPQLPQAGGKKGGELREPVRFDIQNHSFSLYKDVDGKIRSKVVNKNTGEVSYTPPLDSYSFYKAINGDRGMFFEDKI